MTKICLPTAGNYRKNKEIKLRLERLTFCYYYYFIILQLLFIILLHLKFYCVLHVFVGEKYQMSKKYSQTGFLKSF